MSKRKVEVFTTGCPSCVETMRLVETMACSSCEVVEYNIKTQPDGMAKAQEYGIKSTPAVVVDGKVVAVGKPTREQLSEAGIGQP